MALPRFQRMTLEPMEAVLMMIKTEKIEFVPNRKISKFRNLDSKMIFEDLKPMKIIKLEVWLIIELKLRRLGKLITPKWLSLVELKKNLQFEIQSPEFSHLPFFWLELSKLLIEIAPDDIESLEEIKKTLKDLKEVRENKLRTSLKFNLNNQNDQARQRRYNFNNFLNHLEIPNLSHFELNEIRSILTILNSKFSKFDPNHLQDHDDQDLNRPLTSYDDSQLQQRYQSTSSFDYHHYPQSQSQFQFHSDPAFHPTHPGSSSTRNDESNQRSSSILNTSSFTENSN